MTRERVTVAAEARDSPLVRVAVARTRDQEFTEFVRDAGPYLHKTALLLAGDAHRAEELVQETFERTYRAWRKARAGEPRAYARRVLLNLRVDRWRRTRREVVSDAVPPGSVPGHADGVAVRDEVVPGAEQIRRLVGLETESADCVPEDLSVEWGEISSRAVPVLFVAANYETGTGGSAGPDTVVLARVSGPELLGEVRQALLVRADEERQFAYVPFVDNGYGRMDWDFAFEDGWGVWWTTSELRSLPGIVRCDGRPVTRSGATSAEFTITSWNGEDASGAVSCASPPDDPTRVEREALSHCDLDD